MQNDKPIRKKKHFSFFCMIQKKSVAPYGPNSIESDSGPSSGKKTWGSWENQSNFIHFFK